MNRTSDLENTWSSGIIQMLERQARVKKAVSKHWFLTHNTLGSGDFKGF